jgi:hypothetical protein
MTYHLKFIPLVQVQSFSTCLPDFDRFLHRRQHKGAILVKGAEFTGCMTAAGSYLQETISGFIRRAINTTRKMHTL